MSFFDGFLGRGQRHDLNEANRDANAQLEQGRARAIEVGDRFYGEEQNYLRPYVEGGVGANRLLHNALGINGQDAQAGYYRDYQNDPGFQSEVQAGVRALDHSATARGGVYSGANMKAVAGYGQGKMGESYRNRLNMLYQVGGQGQQAAGQAAAAAGRYGGERMNLDYGFGQQSAQNRISLGNALAANRNVGPNNVIGAVGAAARAAAAFSDIRLKRDVARIGTTDGGLPVYEFRYLWSDQPQIGVMAHEAREAFPDAVFEHESGYFMVDYSRIG